MSNGSPGASRRIEAFENDRRVRKETAREMKAATQEIGLAAGRTQRLLDTPKQFRVLEWLVDKARRTGRPGAILVPLRRERRHENDRHADSRREQLGLEIEPTDAIGEANIQHQTSGRSCRA